MLQTVLLFVQMTENCWGGSEPDGTSAGGRSRLCIDKSSIVSDICSSGGRINPNDGGGAVAARVGFSTSALTFEPHHRR